MYIHINHDYDVILAGVFDAVYLYSVYLRAETTSRVTWLHYNIRIIIGSYNMRQYLKIHNIGKLIILSVSP